MRRRIVLLVVATVIAALGATLVLLYVQGLGDKAAAEQQLVKVLTATEVIDPGETAADAQSDGKLALTEIPQGNVIAGALTSVDDLSDQLALAPIYPGEQILAAKFGATVASGQTLAIPKNKIAVSVQLTDPARVAGFVTPGSHVAVFASLDPTPPGSPPLQFTRIVVPNVEVIGVGETTLLSTTKTDDTGTQTTEEIPKTILTLAVDQAEADKVIFAAVNGQIAVGLVPKNTTITEDRGVTMSEISP